MAITEGFEFLPGVPVTLTSEFLIGDLGSPDVVGFADGSFVVAMTDTGFSRVAFFRADGTSSVVTFIAGGAPAIQKLDDGNVVVATRSDAGDVLLSVFTPAGDVVFSDVPLGDTDLSALDVA